MSRVYEALRQSELEQQPLAFPTAVAESIFHEAADGEPLSEATSDRALDGVKSFEVSANPRSRLVTWSSDKGLAAEKFRVLRSRLCNIRRESALRALVISSAVPEEGKSLVAANLAITLAMQGAGKVLLLEGDLRKPNLQRLMGAPVGGGLREWFRSERPITDFLLRERDKQLYLLPAGECDHNPLSVLQTSRFLDMYGELRNQFDWILIDAPPLVPMADVNFWCTHADGMLLVCRRGRTPANVLRRGLEGIDHPQVIGVVLNEVRSEDNTYYESYYSQEASLHSTEEAQRQ